jgi:predicted nuclease of predicted toxin-antitoxin system
VIVPEALRNAGASIELHKDHFVHDEKDTVWLEECGRRGWIVLTKDRNIRYNLVERQALLDSGVAAFVLTSGQMNGAEMAHAYIKALPKITSFLEKYALPFIARVHKDGRVEMWIDSSGEVVP